MTRWNDFGNNSPLVPSGEDLLDQERALIRFARMTPQEVERVNARQHERHINFAQAATELGYLRRDHLMAEMSRQFSYPILSDDTYGQHFSRELVVGHEPFGPAAEAIRSIRTSIVSMAVSQSIRSFVVTSPRRGTGTSFFAANIAIAFAQMAVPTLLVDANLRHPRIADMFGLPYGTEGLSYALRNGHTDDVAVATDVIRGLSILPSGIIPPNPQELLSSANFIALANNLEKMYGVVIYDTAAAMDYADAAITAARVSSAVIVARRHETAFEDVSAVAAKFRATQCKFLGTVMNEF